MQRYISLVNFTAQGIETVTDLPQRVRTARGDLERAGGKLVEWYLTQGEYDVVFIFEAPDEQTATLILLSIARAGNIRTKTLHAFDLDEAEQIVQKMS